MNLRFLSEVLSENAALGRLSGAGRVRAFGDTSWTREAWLLRAAMAATVRRGALRQRHRSADQKSLVSHSRRSSSRTLRAPLLQLSSAARLLCLVEEREHPLPGERESVTRVLGSPRTWVCSSEELRSPRNQVHGFRHESTTVNIATAPYYRGRCDVSTAQTRSSNEQDC